MAEEPGVLLGIDFGGTKALCGLGSARGEVLASERLLVAPLGDADAVVDATLRQAGRLVRGRRVVGIGVSSMGITESDGVRLAPNVPGWDRLHLPERLAQAFPGVPVSIANDVKAACLAELDWGALQGASTYAYLNWGTGIALAFGQAGAVWPGAHGAAGEIAYLAPYGDAAVTQGGAPLEEAFGGGALDAVARERFGLGGGLAAAFAALDQRDDIKAWIDDVMAHVAWATSQALLVLDVERVALGGGLAVQWRRIEPVFSRVWAQHLPMPPRFLAAHFGPDVGLMGALALAARLP